MATAGVSGITRQQLSHWPQNRDLDETTMHRLLEEYLPKLGMQTRKWILDAAAVAAYHAQTQWPVARLLVCDGAPQFTWITEELGLCWVHEGRHYKKLFPYVAQHQKLLEDFLGVVISLCIFPGGRRLSHNRAPPWVPWSNTGFRGEPDTAAIQHH